MYFFVLSVVTFVALLVNIRMLQLKLWEKMSQIRFQRWKTVRKKMDQRVKKSRETKFIVGDSMIKKINGYLLTEPTNHK